MESEEPPENEQKDTRPEARPFNPLVNYVYYLMVVAVALAVQWLFGYPAVIALMMYFVIVLVRETRHIIRTYDYSFARKAAVINLIYSLTFFIILSVNGIAIAQGYGAVIWPDFADLTSWSPLFIMGGIFGVANIKRMYGP
ncbi:hypothetical protein EU546_02480 [Candidatus Thorarchaeota archaeon]|nr:MAG: hypothetical protein EU546_02480 [Candidatus Thorarchaeota archaeon]